MENTRQNDKPMINTGFEFIFIYLFFFTSWSHLSLNKNALETCPSTYTLVQQKKKAEYVAFSLNRYELVCIKRKKATVTLNDKILKIVTNFKSSENIRVYLRNLA